MIKHVFKKLPRKSLGIWVDLHPTRTLHDFLNATARAVVDYIIDWAKSITSPIQIVCNRLWSIGSPAIDRDLINKCILQVYAEYNETYHEQLNRMKLKYTRVLRALAKSDRVAQPYSEEFMKKFGFANASSLRLAIASLTNNQFVYRGIEGDQSWYEINDVIFARWLERI